MERKEKLFTVGFKLIYRNSVGKMTDEELKRELGRAIEAVFEDNISGILRGISTHDLFQYGSQLQKQLRKRV